MCMYSDYPYYCCDNHKLVFMVATISGCFESKTYHVTALGWMKKEEERKEKMNNFTLWLFQVHWPPTGVVHDSCFNWFQTLLSVSHWFELLSCFLTNYVLHNHESIHVTIDCQFAVQQNTVMFYNKLSCVQCIRLEMNFPNYCYVSVSIYDQTNLQYVKKV